MNSLRNSTARELTHQTGEHNYLLSPCQCILKILTQYESKQTFLSIIAITVALLTIHSALVCYRKINQYDSPYGPIKRLNMTRSSLPLCVQKKRERRTLCFFVFVLQEKIVLPITVNTKNLILFDSIDLFHIIIIRSKLLFLLVFFFH